MKALIDGDPLRYSIGFSGESTEHVVVDMETDKEVCSFPNKRALNKWLKENDKPSYAVEARKTLAPLEFVLGRCKTKLTEILRETRADDYEIFLSGGTNFREELVDYYKANRDPNHKPVYFLDIEKYLLRNWNTTVVEGIEADDAVGLSQTDSTIICSIDKDLDGVPGWHYWTDKGPYMVTEEDALWFFYKQLLMGDTTDNIRGVPWIGKAKAEKAIRDCNSEADYFCAALATYENHYGQEEGFKMMNENAHLLWIQRAGRIKWYGDENNLEEMMHVFVSG